MENAVLSPSADTFDFNLIGAAGNNGKVQGGGKGDGGDGEDPPITGPAASTFRASKGRRVVGHRKMYRIRRGPSEDRSALRPSECWESSSGSRRLF